MTVNKLHDNLSMPACTIIPVLEYANLADAIAWLTENFGFQERWRVGTHRAQLSYEDSAIAITELVPGRAISKATIMVRVRNVATCYELAQKHHAEIVRPPSDFPYGERQFTVKDLGGHVWTFSQTIANVVPEEWGAVSAEL